MTAYRVLVKKMWIGLCILAVVLVLIVAGYHTSRSGYESAPYNVVRTDGLIAVRDYPALTVVETTMTRTSNADDGSFMRLFRFITGGNEAKQKIAMTTPVFMSGNNTNRTMAFVLPAKLKAEDVPRPNDGAVAVRELPGGRFAVLRFSGGRKAQQEAEALARLQTWLAAQGLKATGEPVYGYFDPPWTPSFLRRNEVMLRIETHQQ